MEGESLIAEFALSLQGVVEEMLGAVADGCEAVTRVLLEEVAGGTN